MRYALFAIVSCLGALTTTSAFAQVQCQPAGFSRTDLDALKAANWALPNATRRNALARGLTSCLSNPDPTLRDAIAFEALSHWLRARELSTETMLWLAGDLELRLTAPEGPGFERPFAALVLSEVARADRIEAYMTPERRARLLDASIAYFTAIRDYRGFDEREGWRHSVAHGSDLLLQLALNPALGRPDLTRIRDAVATQLAPPGQFYVYGESERLVRPVLFMAQRNVFSAEEWQTWLVHETAVGEDAYSSQTALARRHNMMAFLSILYMQASLSENADDNALLPGAEAALRALP